MILKTNSPTPKKTPAPKNRKPIEPAGGLGGGAAVGDDALRDLGHLGEAVGLVPLVGLKGSVGFVWVGGFVWAVCLVCFFFFFLGGGKSRNGKMEGTETGGVWWELGELVEVFGWGGVGFV